MTFKKGHKMSSGKNNPSYKHGMALRKKPTRFYNIWSSMKARCNYPSNAAYNRYGGRGIKVCERWEKFENFRDDLYKSYILHTIVFGEKQTTIDRIDNKSGYRKENCRWANYYEQASNTRKNHFLIYNGKRQTIAQWARELKIKKGTLQTRLGLGWSTEDVLTKKKRKGKCKGFYFNKSKGNWYAQGYKNGLKKHLGMFNDPKEARNAYLNFNKQKDGIS